MGKIHEISYTVINTRIDKGVGTRFTVKEVCDEIIKKGGILRVAIGITIKDYLDSLNVVGILNFIHSDNDEITYEVAATGVDDAEIVVANRTHEVYPTHHRDDYYL